MSSVEKTIDLTKQVAQMNEEILKTMLKDFLRNKSTKRGQVRFGELAQRAGGKLESIEVSDNNIRNFLDVAKKYDIDFSLKCDKSTVPPTYHVFFASNKEEKFQKAFTEYVHGVQNRYKQKTYTVNREQVNKNAKNISMQNNENTRDKQKVRQRNQNINGR